MPAPNGHERVGLIDPVAMLQASLGVDEAQARDLASIEVVCPVPAVPDKPGEPGEALPARNGSLGDFMTSPHGADKAETIVGIARKAREAGASPVESIAQALGFAAVRDNETGELARVPTPTPKKKLTAIAKRLTTARNPKRT